eukprot:gene29250-36268_t
MCGGTAKEIHFFDRPQEYSQGVSHYMHNFHHPECRMKGRHFIDSTPNYLDHEETPQRIASTYSPSDLKKKRFVIVLRDPVYRSYSWYNHMMKHCVASMHSYLSSAAAHHTTMPSTGWNTTLLCSDSRHCEDVQCLQRASRAKLGSEVQFLATFSDYYTSGALDTSKGHYMEQIRRWLDIVPRSQIFILNLATLLTNTSDSMNRITDFLGLKTHFNSGITLPHDNTATVVTDFPCEVRTTLYKVMDPYTVQLMSFMNGEGEGRGGGGVEGGDSSVKKSSVDLPPPEEPVFPPFKEYRC